MRLKVASISKNNPHLLDAGITHFVKRNKITPNQKVNFLNPKELNIKKLKPLNIYEQSKYKYIINIEGNAAAYRFGGMFRLKSVQINIKSEYKLWFEPLLKNKHFIEIDNIEQLLDKIKELKMNDKKAQKIANNGFNFYKKKLNKKFICKYLFIICYRMNQKMNQKMNYPYL